MGRLAIIKGFLALATLFLAGSSGFAQDTLKLAIGQRGLWETSLSAMGQDAGIREKQDHAIGRSRGA